MHIEYLEDRYLPTFVSTSSGRPFTGRTYGTNGIADWIGSFIDGLPHGEFTLVLGDHMRDMVWFEHGVIVEHGA